MLVSHLRRNLVAYLALFLALSGTAVAAAPLITGSDVKNSSLTTKDVKNRSLLRKDFKKGQVPRGPAGPAGTALAYAHVSATGEVDPDRSDGITDANVTHPETGNYCFDDLAFTLHGMVANSGQTGPPVFATTSVPTTNATLSPCEPGQARVRTFDAAGQEDDATFFVIFQ